jgi:hypothetical protein
LLVRADHLVEIGNSIKARSLYAAAEGCTGNQPEFSIIRFSKRLMDRRARLSALENSM